MFNSVFMCDVNLHHVINFIMRFMKFSNACAYSVYQALLFSPPREARASPYAEKRGTGDEAKRSTGSHKSLDCNDNVVEVQSFVRCKFYYTEDAATHGVLC